MALAGLGRMAREGSGLEDQERGEENKYTRRHLRGRKKEKEEYDTVEHFIIECEDYILPSKN